MPSVLFAYLILEVRLGVALQENLNKGCISSFCSCVQSAAFGLQRETLIVLYL